MPGIDEFGEKTMRANSTPCLDIYQHISQCLEDMGYCIIKSALSDKITQELYQRVIRLPKKEFSRAGIGRRGDLHINSNYRTDEIHWLETTVPAEAAFLAWMEQLRLEMNHQLFMGLWDYEAHFAHYAPGTFYSRHLDAFKGTSNRVVTTVFYLNPEWVKNDGGDIFLYEDETSQTPFKIISPDMGTLVLFLSDQFPHEVVCAQRDRYSIAGWFRIKSLPTKLLFG